MKIFSNRSLLITRPIKDGVVFSLHIKKLKPSIDSICNPLFEIENFSIDRNLSKFNAIIVTSSNAVRSLIQSEVQFSGPIFCVGNSTALLAKSGGYRAKSANGNTRDLIELVKSSATDGLVKLIYFRGERIMVDLGSALRKEHFDLDEEICYRKVRCRLPNKTIESIKSGTIVGATFFSKETVDLFFNQVKNIPVGFVAFCISTEVSRNILTLYPDFRLSVRAAVEPSMEGMCKLIVAAPEFGD